MEGKHYHFKNNAFCIFGQYFSYVRTREKASFAASLITKWAINLRECKPDPIAPQIEKSIKKHKGPIDHIVIDALTAGKLFLEGKLCQELFLEAQEDENSVIVVSELAGEKRKLIIRKVTQEPFKIQ